MKSRLKREVGNWVDGDRFWDRIPEVAGLIELLDEGANVLIVAPRRVGKTSLMRETARRIGDRYHCLFVDLQRGSTPADAIVELSLATRPVRSLWSRTAEVFRNSLSTLRDPVEELGVDDLMLRLHGGLDEDWPALGTRLLAALAEADRGVVLFLDEFPILVNRIIRGVEGRSSPARIAQADALLSWLRAMAQAHRGRLRFVLAGSIGLEPVLRLAGLSATTNAFTPFHLEPWDHATALGALGALAAEVGLTWTDDADARLVRRLGVAVPHHVQMFFSFILEHARRTGQMSVGPATVDLVYQRRMLSSRGHAQLSHMEERLAMVLDARLVPLAWDLLTEAAVTGVLTPQAARRLFARGDLYEARQLRDTLALLEHDGYLNPTAGGHVFESSLLKDWWAARFGSTFEPLE